MPLELQAASSDSLAFGLSLCSRIVWNAASVLCLKSALHLEPRDEQGQAEAE